MLKEQLDNILQLSDKEQIKEFVKVDKGGAFERELSVEKIDALRDYLCNAPDLVFGVVFIILNIENNCQNVVELGWAFDTDSSSDSDCREFHEKFDRTFMEGKQEFCDKCNDVLREYGYFNE